MLNLLAPLNFFFNLRHWSVVLFRGVLFFLFGDSVLCFACGGVLGLCFVFCRSSCSVALFCWCFCSGVFGDLGSCLLAGFVLCSQFLLASCCFCCCSGFGSYFVAPTLWVVELFVNYEKRKDSKKLHYIKSSAINTHLILNI